MDILKNITDQLGGKITEANFEGANIVLYTKDENFFREGESKIKSIVDQIKKRIELRADQKILPDKETAEVQIRKIVPVDAEITEIIFDVQRSIVVIEDYFRYLSIRRNYFPYLNLCCFLVRK